MFIQVYQERERERAKEASKTYITVIYLSFPIFIRLPNAFWIDCLDKTVMSVPKIFLSLFYKTNLNAFRTAILTNDTNRICRILDVERAHICKELDNAGNTALLLAIQYASPLTVRVLLEQGAHPDQTNFNTFQTPLSVLAAMSFEKNECHGAKTALEMATILLDHGAFIDKPTLYKFTDESGTDYSIRETPLMIAVRTKNLPMATLFVERKANVNYCEKLTDNRS